MSFDGDRWLNAARCYGEGLGGRSTLSARRPSGRRYGERPVIATRVQGDGYPDIVREYGSVAACAMAIGSSSTYICDRFRVGKPIVRGWRIAYKAGE